MRIVSLLPSATEIVCELGLADQLVGVSHECDYPDSIRGIPIVTRSKLPSDLSSFQIDQIVRQDFQAQASLFSLRLDLLSELAPDLIVTQSLCEVCAVADFEIERALKQWVYKPKVLNLSPRNLREMFDSIQAVGLATGTPQRATEAIDQLQRRVQRVVDSCKGIEPMRPDAVILEWLDPLFSAGHWNPELIDLAGGRECIGHSGSKSESISWERLVDANPDVLLIACCGYTIPKTLQDLPSLQGRPGFQELRAVRNHRVFIADGNAYFNRPGPRLVDTLEMIAHCLHPNHNPLPPAVESGLLRMDPIGQS
jgi:iron complex transport system substrate-binding protein